MSKKFTLIEIAILGVGAASLAWVVTADNKVGPNGYVGLLPTVPGAINPDVTQATIATTICQRGWTATIRPPVSYTGKWKSWLFKSQHLAGSPSDYELDHKVPLEVGGAPSDHNNLWMQPYAGIYGAKKSKDPLENTIKSMVCAHKITLEEGRKVFLVDWIAGYHTYIGKIAGE